MAEGGWSALLERVEQGLTTGDDADAIRDLLEEMGDLKMELAKLNDEELFDIDEDGGE